MATVYQAWDREQKAPCAIKLLRPGHPQADELCRRFLTEARIIAELNHPNIVRLHDSGVMPDGAAYLAMELLQGQDLQQLLSRTEPLPVAQALRITSQVGSALHSIHSRGIVHRDIKPQNIYLCSGASPDEVTVKVIDFGLSKFPSGSSREHSDGLVIGTLEYLAPEATLGISALVDARTDQWALAVVTYRMLTGALPFALGTDPVEGLVRIRSATVRPVRELAPWVPEHIELAIDRALSKDKEKRFPCIQEFVRVLCASAEDSESFGGVDPAEPSWPDRDTTLFLHPSEAAKNPSGPDVTPTRIVQVAPTLVSGPGEYTAYQNGWAPSPCRRHSFWHGGIKLGLAMVPLLFLGFLRLVASPSPVSASPAPVGRAGAPISDLAVPSLTGLQPGRSVQAGATVRYVAPKAMSKKPLGPMRTVVKPRQHVASSMTKKRFALPHRPRP